MTWFSSDPWGDVEAHARWLEATGRAAESPSADAVEAAEVAHEAWLAAGDPAAKVGLW